MYPMVTGSKEGLIVDSHMDGVPSGGLMERCMKVNSNMGN